jgi:hypothetical protein
MPTAFDRRNGGKAAPWRPAPGKSRKNQHDLGRAGISFHCASFLLAGTRDDVMTDAANMAHRLSMRVNWVIERACVLLMVLLVLDVWLGILVRYVIPIQITFTEELARYLMIWMALLAVSCGIAHREHIGVTMIFE